MEEKSADPVLYLVPTLLGEADATTQLPPINIELIGEVRHFIVENIRSARRFLVNWKFPEKIDNLTFIEWDKHAAQQDFRRYLQPLTNGFSVAMLSEAGCPAVADPGAEIVQQAHLKGFRVRPLIGPNSMILALMASGLNGQSFAFGGYLPVKNPDRSKAIQRLEQRSRQEKQTQLFIEAPYRNKNMFNDLLLACAPETKLCVAVDLTLKTEWVKTFKIKEWKNIETDLDKRPAIFLILA